MSVQARGDAADGAASFARRKRSPNPGSTAQARADIGHRKLAPVPLRSNDLWSAARRGHCERRIGQIGSGAEPAARPERQRRAAPFDQVERGADKRNTRENLRPAKRFVGPRRPFVARELQRRTEHVVGKRANFVGA